MPFAHQDVLEVRQRQVVCCYKRQNFLSHVLRLLNEAHGETKSPKRIKCHIYLVSNVYLEINLSRKAEVRGFLSRHEHVRTVRFSI